MQIDLLDFFRGRYSWRKLYDLLDQLPYWGHYKTALAMDEEWARRMVDMEEEGEEGLPGATTEDEDPTPLYYDPALSRLDLIADRLMAVRGAVIATAGEGGEEPHWTPIPRPVTAIEKERENRARIVVSEFEALVFGAGLALGGKQIVD